MTVGLDSPERIRSKASSMRSSGSSWRIAGHGPTLYQSGLPSKRRLELVSAKPLRSGAAAMHYQRAR